MLSRKGLPQRKGSDFPSHWSQSQTKPSSDTLGTLKSCGFEGGISITSLLPPSLPARKIKVDSAEELLKEEGNRRNNNLPEVSKSPSKAPNKPLPEAWNSPGGGEACRISYSREYQLEKAEFREISYFQ